MFSLLHALSELLQPVIVPVCFITTWVVIFMLFSNLLSMGREGIKQAKRLHTIPCANCVFFTGDYHLKCTVNPTDALTERAIHCPDYRPSAERR